MPAPPAPPIAPPLPRERIVDRYFLEHRGKVLDLAAFLDRVDRATPREGEAEAEEDFRVTALRDAIALLVDGEPHRARRILDLWSDTTEEPIPTAPTKGAVGVPRPNPGKS